MKKLIYMLPFLFCGLIAFYIVGVDNPNKQNHLELKVEQTQESQPTDTKFVENFIDQNKFALTEEGLSKIKLKKDKKDYEFNQLNETKKYLLQFMAINKCRKNLDKFTYENNLKIAENESLKVFSKKLDEEVDRLKKILYKIHGTTLHPLDKDFLESIK